MEGGGGRSSKGRASPFRKEASRPSGASRVPDQRGKEACTWVYGAPCLAMLVAGRGWAIHRRALRGSDYMGVQSASPCEFQLTSRLLSRTLFNSSGEKEQRTRSCLPASLYPRPLPSPLEKTSKPGWPANSVKLGTFHFCKVENSKSWLWIHRPCKPRAKVIWLQKPDFPILGVSPLNWMLERCCDTSKPLCYLSSSRKFIHLPKYSTCSPGVDGNCEYMLDLSHTHITYLCESHVIPSSTCAP